MGGPGRLAEKRLTDIGNMQPIWKYGNGSVGSQALLGIPHLPALRNDEVLAPVSRVWPFETGLAALPSRAERDYLIVHAEMVSVTALDPANCGRGEGCGAGQDDGGPLCEAGRCRGALRHVRCPDMPYARRSGQDRTGGRLDAWGAHQPGCAVPSEPGASSRVALDSEHRYRIEEP